MADGRKNNGGAREGSGRKPKVEEQKLVEKLTPLEPLAFAALEKGLLETESWATKMFFEYMYGKPKESKDINLFQQNPIFNSLDLDVIDGEND